MKQSIPKLSEKIEYFPLWEEHFEVFTSMVGFVSSFLAVHDMIIGDVSKLSIFHSKGFSEEHIKTAKVAWTCLTENLVNHNLFGGVFATKARNAGWRMWCDWFLPKIVVEQVKWLVAFDAAKLEKGEEPMKCFGRIDKLVGVPASLGFATIGSRRQPQDNHDPHLRQ